MSTIHVSSKAVINARSKAPAQDIQSQVPVGTPNRTSDRDLPQAWSIGVTDSAREWSSAPEKNAETMPETCPPEVYIG